MAVPSQRTLRVVCILLLVALPCLVEAARKKKKGDTPPLPSVRFYKSTVKVSYAGVAKIPSTATQGAAVQSRQVLENPRSQIGGRRLLEDDSIDLGTPGTDPSATDPAVEDGEPNLDFDPRPLLPPAELTGATADLEAAKKKKPKAFLSLTVAPFSPSVLKSGVTAKQTASTGTAAYASDSSVPDPSVCAGSNYVVQVVNWAIVVFDGSGKALTAPVALNEFLGVNPYRGTTVGDLVTKASCVYDSATKRFFLSAAWLAGSSNAYDKFGQTRTDNKGVSRGSGIVVAVSAAEKPLDAWSVYFVGTTNDGTNGPDDHLAPLAYTGELFYNTYPRLGVDANGVYVTTQQATYSNVDDVWQGSNIFAFSKAALLKQSDITAVRFALPRMSRTDQTVLQYWTIEPAASPADGKYDLTNKGTMWFGAYDVSWAMSGHSAVFAFALTNTVSLSANNPTLTLLTAIANCSFYYDWSTSQQKPGLAPLAESYNKDTPLIVPPRSSSVALSTGFLWMVVPTGSTMSPNSEAGFMLVKMKATVAKGPSPALNLAVASAMIYNVPMANLIAPTIAFNKLGKGIILATLVSPNNYPTVGFVRVTKAGISPKDLKFYTVVQSSAPLDVDSQSYSAKSTDPVAFVRYGTTQALAVDATGTVWAAGQYATEERTTRNNWATSLFSVTP
ncbi:unnamed protein product [Closterium sp. Naga37s-1]|nr:unnamed protein product [Closterium sp. Naga37s-1]CAI5521318.1 unnamed protein product [Closterium sp. Naga37s-1]